MGFQIGSKSSFRTFVTATIFGLLATAISFCAPSSVPGQGFRAIPRARQVPIASRMAANRVAPVESKNFVVYANDPVLARKVSKEAERFRKELSIEWLGKEIPAWRDKCPITVEIGMNAGGETSFAFIQDQTGVGKPIDWKMKIYGPPNRLLDAVLPHEVTHTIFATHFGRPLPRWADEGACTTVEHESERRKNHKMLLEFLTSQPSRGIPFNRMFTMRNYPHDILPLYAQGYSLARFLISKKGKRHFVNYVGQGLQNEGRMHELRAWDSATNEFYKYKNLSDLQIDWLAWVKNGSNDSKVREDQNGIGQLARLGRSATTNEPESIQPSVYLQNKLKADQQVAVASFVEVSPIDTSSTYRTADLSNRTADLSKSAAVTARGSDPAITPVTPTSIPKGLDLGVEAKPQSSLVASGSWYAREMKKGENRVASKLESFNSNQTRKVPSNGSPSARPPVAHDTRLPIEYQAVPATMWR